ncbi:DedA family protein [Modestobacter sp. SSW1-42]|uniref:DedA family protein n=1 Tax=Modestobacter sp. SSW1-42 TaxID=596372 RepID=UPI0039886FE0
MPGPAGRPAEDDVLDSLLDTVTSVMSSPWVYLLIALVAAADALVPVAPSETVVITAGVFAASGSTEVPLVVATAAAGALAGDHLSYLLGRLTSGRARSRRLTRVLALADSLLGGRRGTALVVARYVPGGRTAVTLGMGVLRHPLGHFARWDAVAALSWAAYCTGVGVLGGAAFAEDPLPAVLLGMAVAVGVAGLTELVRHRRRASLTTASGLPAAGPVSSSR